MMETTLLPLQPSQGRRWGTILELQNRLSNFVTLYDELCGEPILIQNEIDAFNQRNPAQ
jgi:hypothetical protein